MNEQEQKIAKGIIGTLIFVIVFLVFQVVGLPSLAVSYVNPNLSAGPFDLWTMATGILMPVATAYILVSTKIGAGVVMLVAAIINRIMSPAAAATPQAIDTKRFASAAKTAEVLKAYESRIQSLEAQVAEWKAEEE